MQAAELDLLVEFQQPTFARNARNELVSVGWERIVRVAARREPINDAQRAAAAQVERIVTDRFVTYFSAQLAAFDLTQQLLVDGVAYAIVDRKSVRGPGEGRRAMHWLEWTCAAKPGMTE